MARHRRRPLRLQQAEPPTAEGLPQLVARPEPAAAPKEQQVAQPELEVRQVERQVQPEQVEQVAHPELEVQQVQAAALKVQQVERQVQAAAPKVQQVGRPEPAAALKVQQVAQPEPAAPRPRSAGAPQVRVAAPGHRSPARLGRLATDHSTVQEPEVRLQQAVQGVQLRAGPVVSEGSVARVVLPPVGPAASAVRPLEAPAARPEVPAAQLEVRQVPMAVPAVRPGVPAADLQVRPGVPVADLQVRPGVPAVRQVRPVVPGVPVADPEVRPVVPAVRQVRPGADPGVRAELPAQLGAREVPEEGPAVPGAEAVERPTPRSRRRSLLRSLPLSRPSWSARL